jgi:hypothetical protein
MQKSKSVLGLRSSIINYLSVLAISGMLASVTPSGLVAAEESKEVVEQIFIVQGHLKQKYKKKTKIPKRPFGEPDNHSKGLWTSEKSNTATRQSKLFILHKALIFYG